MKSCFRLAILALVATAVAYGCSSDPTSGTPLDAGRVVDVGSDSPVQPDGGEDAGKTGGIGHMKRQPGANSLAVDVSNQAPWSCTQQCSAQGATCVDGTVGQVTRATGDGGSTSMQLGSCGEIVNYDPTAVSASCSCLGLPFSPPMVIVSVEKDGVFTCNEVCKSWSFANCVGANLGRPISDYYCSELPPEGAKNYVCTCRPNQ